jgi:4-amino-4-deoxy-L-arabinose transferase-like glycosyltransferase
VPEVESNGLGPDFARRLPLFLGAYFLAHLAIRLVVSDTLALDEAEQVVLGQWFQWGYAGQPPLYAWVQHVLFEILGTNLLALALLKNGLLLLAYLAFWWTAQRMWPHRSTTAVLAVLSWLLIPQIVWEAQRDLSHSVLVLTMASLSLWAVVRALARQPGSMWYLAYGLLMGLGMLSKYNFVVFAGALNLALLALPEGRRILLTPRLFLAVGAFATVWTPHFLWAVDHWEVAVRSLGKVEASAANNRLAGMGALILATISFLTPLWIAWLGFFPGLFRGPGPGASDPVSRLLRRYLLVLAGGLTFAVLVLGVGHVKERWMIPFLFLTPLYLLGRAAGKSLPPGRTRWFARVAVGAGSVVLLAASTRVVLGPRLGVTTRVNYPFTQVAAALPPEARQDVTILTHNTWFAGNLLKRLPHAQAYVPGYVLPPPKPDQPVLLVWDAARSPGLPAEIREDLVNRFGLDPEDGRLESAGSDPSGPRYLTFPYKFGAGREARVAYLVLRSGEPQG